MLASTLAFIRQHPEHADRVLASVLSPARMDAVRSFRQLIQTRRELKERIRRARMAMPKRTSEEAYVGMEKARRAERRCIIGQNPAWNIFAEAHGVQAPPPAPAPPRPRG